MHHTSSAWVYMMASRKNGTLYIGVTRALRHRIWQHKYAATDGFTKDYRVSTLFYFEELSGIRMAIRREKQLKGWRRERKIQLIESSNPDWTDLAREWFARPLDPSQGSG